jgi:hypothetical protein
MTVTFKTSAVVLCLGFLGSCGNSAPPLSTHRMGEKVKVGPLIYTVLSADWRADFGDGAEKSVAKDRFVIIQLSITNSGGEQEGSPLTQLIDAQGKEHGEVQEVKNLPQWLGLLRLLSPASTDTGKIVFDVPRGGYKLKVSGGSTENEKTALIDIPLDLTSATAPAVTNLRASAR